MPSIDNQDEVDRVRSYMQALQDEISGLKVYPRIFARYPFDLIGFALVSKAFQLAEPCWSSSKPDLQMKHLV